MSEYLDVISFKKTASGKTFAVRLGSAKQLDNGNIAVYLDALPIPGPDGCQITIAPQRERLSGARTVTAKGRDLDDDLIF